MKLKFQNWIENANFSINTNHLLNNSVLCYKAEAYSAALLMSYLGLLVILKERILQGNKPTLYPLQSWKDLIKELQNEDKWEEAVFTAIQQQEKRDNSGRTQDPIFVINENLRIQLKYWKDRRNDCVHNKDNAIIISHVEAFWSFMESNLQKITIEGGKATLLNKIIRHYDITYTPSNVDVTPLVEQINSSVEKSQMPSFWVEVFEGISDLFDYSNEIDFTNKGLKLNNPHITESLMQYLKNQKNILDQYINENPSIIAQLDLDKQQIRKFWKTELKKMQNSIGVYASMLRNNLIPKEEIDAANQHVALFGKYEVSQADHYVLSENGFGEVIYNNLFVVQNAQNYKYWQFMNENYKFFTRYVEFYPLKDEVVKILCNELSKTDWKPLFLQTSLNQLFIFDQNKKNEFITIASKLQVPLPTNLEGECKLNCVS